MRKTQAYFEQVPIEVVEKILARQNARAEQPLANAAAAGAAPVAATPEFPAALRGNSHQQKTTNPAGRSLSRKGSK